MNNIIKLFVIHYKRMFLMEKKERKHKLGDNMWTFIYTKINFVHRNHCNIIKTKTLHFIDIFILKLLRNKERL